jgi:hypothetical protein
MSARRANGQFGTDVEATGGKRLKLAEARDVVAAAAAIYELVGQSSVALTLDSKGAIKPDVKVYHRDAHEASRLAQELFDEQLLKYVFKPVAGA